MKFICDEHEKKPVGLRMQLVKNLPGTKWVAFGYWVPKNEVGFRASNLLIRLAFPCGIALVCMHLTDVFMSFQHFQSSIVDHIQQTHFFS
jgi:hypothetical protein